MVKRLALNTQRLLTCCSKVPSLHPRCLFPLNQTPAASIWIWSVHPFIHSSFACFLFLSPLCLSVSSLLPGAGSSPLCSHIPLFIKIYTVFLFCRVGKKNQLLHPSRGQQSCFKEVNPLRRSSDLPQRLLQSLAVGLITANHRLPLLVLLLVEDPQEVTQLRDGECIPLKRGESKTKTTTLFFTANFRRERDKNSFISQVLVSKSKFWLLI